MPGGESTGACRLHLVLVFTKIGSNYRDTFRFDYKGVGRATGVVGRCLSPHQIVLTLDKACDGSHCRSLLIRCDDIGC